MTTPQAVPCVEILFEIHPDEGFLGNASASEVAFEELRRQLEYQHSNLSFELRDKLQDGFLPKKQRAGSSSATSFTDTDGDQTDRTARSKTYQAPSLARFMDSSTDTTSFSKPAVLGLREPPQQTGKAFFVETDFPGFGIERQEGAIQKPAGHPFGQPPLYEPYKMEETSQAEMDVTQRFPGDRRFRCVRYE